MKLSKSDLIAILFGTILLIIVIITAILSFAKSDTPPPQQEVNITAYEPTNTPTPVLNPNIPIITYDENDQDKLMDKIENRKPLSDNDAFSEATILATLPKENPSGVLYQSETIIIDYTNSANMFQVEILTTDINAAKAEANIWFRARGMSQKGICDLPLMFYLNYEIRSQLKNTGAVFSPLANSC